MVSLACLLLLTATVASDCGNQERSGSVFVPSGCVSGFSFDKSQNLPEGPTPRDALMNYLGDGSDGGVGNARARALAGGYPVSGWVEVHQSENNATFDSRGYVLRVARVSPEAWSISSGQDCSE